MSDTIARECLIRKLRELGYSYKRRGERVELYRSSTSYQVVGVPHKKRLDVQYVRMVLRLCGLSEKEIEEFLRAATV